jgi:hypothetical protein
VSSLPKKLEILPFLYPDPLHEWITPSHNIFSTPRPHEIIHDQEKKTLKEKKKKNYISLFLIF